MSFSVILFIKQPPNTREFIREIQTTMLYIQVAHFDIPFPRDVTPLQGDFTDTRLIGGFCAD